MDSPDEAKASNEAQSPLPTCRVAIVGIQRHRVAKAAAALLADESFGRVSTSSLLGRESKSSGTMALDGPPADLPAAVRIEYLPCVATFGHYEDGSGALVRYLAKVEYHGPDGTLAVGRSLAPFFDDCVAKDADDVDEDEKNPFPGIAAAGIGCGIEAEEDADRIRSLLENLSSSCAVQVSNGELDDSDVRRKMLIECIQPNHAYSSMKEENEAFRVMNKQEKREALLNGTIGPGKMANFVYRVANDAITQRWKKELIDFEQLLQVDQQQMPSSNSDQTAKMQLEAQSPATEESMPVPDELTSTPNAHVPDPEKTRYACKLCRTILFGTDDLEDPPHTPSLHGFRKKTGGRAGRGNAARPCHTHFLAQPLPWMDDGCAELEGKLSCPKCRAKVGHYSWTGAQCSCGTWVTPAIAIPMSRVDKMGPASQNVIVASGALFVNGYGF